MRSLLITLFLFFSIIVSAQEKQTIVTLKSGTELKGVIKSIDPTDALIIVIAGIETTIKMDDVARIEEEDSATKTTVSQLPIPQLTEKDKLVVTDNGNYPESFKLVIRNDTLRMILIKGGEMNMGYDGRGSMDMNSEPVHQVGVTSFYISQSYLPYTLAKKFSDKRVNHVGPFFTGNWKAIEALVKKIAEDQKMPLRLPTEAEWEFAACSDKQAEIFYLGDDDEYCQDYYDNFSVSGYKVDPTGPLTGKTHVVRHYKRKDNKKFERNGSYLVSEYIRLAIKAKDVKFK